MLTLVLQKAGTAKQSFTADLLNADDYTKQKEYALKTCAATIFAGGATTVSNLAVRAFFLDSVSSRLRVWSTRGS